MGRNGRRRHSLRCLLLCISPAHYSQLDWLEILSETAPSTLTAFGRRFTGSLKSYPFLRTFDGLSFWFPCLTISSRGNHAYDDGCFILFHLIPIYSCLAVCRIPMSTDYDCMMYV
ncbi:hypothetical protein BDW71DRAFT_12266 [Aspergillus fruticulosus]